MGKIKEKPIEAEAPIAIESELKEELVDGIIDGAVCVNIRREPEVKPNNQIAILGKGTKIVVVDPKKEVANKDGVWVKIRIVDKDCISTNPEKDPTRNGFAMKKFIKII